MTHTIRTKFHKIKPLVEEDEVYISAPKNELGRHWSYLDPNKEMFNWLLEKISELPKFVIEDELMELAIGEKFHQSLLDMKKANVLRLPFPAITIEFNLPPFGRRAIVMLRDNQSGELASWEPPGRQVYDGTLNGQRVTELAFYGIIFILENDFDGDYLVINPGIIGIDVVDDDGAAMLRISADESNLFKDLKLQNEILGKTYTKNVAYIWRALCAAMLLMHTEGVTKEVIECEKINKKRKRDGKSIIPSHTYLKIGKVYKSSSSNESSEYIHRRSPRPHWRRGHLKSYWHGPGKTLKKQKYINPRIVSLKEEVEEPSMKKTYQVGV